MKIQMYLHLCIELIRSRKSGTEHTIPKRDKRTNIDHYKTNNPAT